MDPEETLVVVVSKTFTTAETMLNARTVRKWLIAQLGACALVFGLERVFVCVGMCSFGFNKCSLGQCQAPGPHCILS